MTDNIENIDLDSDDFANAPTGLREYAKNLKSRLAERDQLIGKYQDEALGSVLTQAGFANPNRVRSAIAADKIDLSDRTKVNEWIATNGNDFARGAQAPAELQQEQPDHTAQALVQHQMQDLQNVATPSGAVNAFEKVKAEITNTMDKDEVLARLRSAGV